MPDPKQMSGIPRPVTDLPNGSVSVRLIRGQMSNNIAGHPIDLHVGSKVITVKTDESGRAQFDKLTPGTPVKATAEVDGEHLESQEFPAPGQNGIRLLLVATDTSKPAEAAVPAVTGQVVLGSNSRILIEPGEETVQVYVLLDIANNARGPVKTATPFTFDLPADATNCGALDGSSPLAKVEGKKVSIAAPFPPGSTFLQIACEVAAPSGDLQLSQRFPAVLEQLAVVVKKVGDTKLTAPQLARQQEMPAQGATYIAGTGPALPAGTPITLSITGMPHHSPWPRWITLGIAVGIVVSGVWAASRGPRDAPARSDERKRLVAKREKLFNDLVRLERDQRNLARGGQSGRGQGHDDRRYESRREELMASLELVYGALEDEGLGPDPIDRGGVAA